MRETVLLKAIDLLEKKDFHVSSFIYSNSCFDLVAKKQNLTFLIKVYSNIDSIREEQALELLKLSSILNARAIVLGERTKVFKLKQGIVYERYSLPVMAIASFNDFLNESIPSIKFFKGKNIVELDAERLKEKRESLNLSLQELAEKIHSTRESLYRYEQGNPAELENVQRLEKVLKISLIKEPDSFEEFFEEFSPAKKIEFSAHINDKALEKIHELGFNLVLFEHAPFKAITNPEESLLISKASQKSELAKKVSALESAKSVIPGHSLIVTKHINLKNISQTPLIEEEELSTFSKRKDLLKELKKREQSK
ncbi:MAG: helix-turn-helix domain-containing protein [archaeon]|nr:helix-turn-helix domain-containing protein [archaeon]